MEIVPANNNPRRRAGNLALQALGPVAYQALVNDFRSLIRSSGLNQGGGQHTRQRQQKQKKSKGQGQVASNAPPPRLSVPGGIGGSQYHRATYRDVLQFANPSSGATFLSYNLGFVPTSGTTNIFGLFTATTFPRVAAMSALYKEFVLNSITFQFVPYASTSIGGSVAFGIDPDPSAGLATSLAAVARHKVACISDLQDKCRIVYKPAMDGKRDPRYVLGNQSSGSPVRSDDEVAFGTFQSFSANTAGASNPIGYFVMTADITFMGPQ